MLVDAIKRKIPIYETPIGHMHFKKNSIINYDEITNMPQLIESIIPAYINIERSVVGEKHFLLNFHNTTKENDFFYRITFYVVLF